MTCLAADRHRPRLARSYDRLRNAKHVDTVIGHDAWFGYRTTVRSGMRIGNGAIIPPGSILVDDVAAPQ